MRNRNRNLQLGLERLEERKLLATFQDNMLDLGQTPNLDKPGGSTEDYYALVGTQQSASIHTSYVPHPFSTVTKISYTFVGVGDVLDSSLTSYTTNKGDFVYDSDQKKEWTYPPGTAKGFNVQHSMFAPDYEGLLTLRVEVTAQAPPMFGQPETIFYDEIILDVESPELQGFTVDRVQNQSVVFQATDIKVIFQGWEFTAQVKNDTHFNVRVGFVQTMNFIGIVDRTNEAAQIYGDTEEEVNRLMDDPPGDDAEVGPLWYDNPDTDIDGKWIINAIAIPSNATWTDLEGDAGEKTADQPLAFFLYEDTGAGTHEIDSIYWKMEFETEVIVWGFNFGPNNAYVSYSMPVSLGKAQWNTGINGQYDGTGARNSASNWNMIDLGTVSGTDSGPASNDTLTEWNGNAQTLVLTANGTSFVSDMHFMNNEIIKTNNNKKKHVVEKITDKLFNIFEDDTIFINHKKKTKALKFQYN